MKLLGSNILLLFLRISIEINDMDGSPLNMDLNVEQNMNIGGCKCPDNVYCVDAEPWNEKQDLEICQHFNPNGCLDPAVKELCPRKCDQKDHEICHYINPDGCVDPSVRKWCPHKCKQIITPPVNSSSNESSTTKPPDTLAFIAPTIVDTTTIMPGLLEKVIIANSGGIAKASSSYSIGNNEPNKAFGDSGFWHNDDPFTVPQTLWVEFENPLRIVRYSFTSRTNDNNNHPYIVTDGPSKYIFWASNHGDCTDESQWVELHVDDSGTPFTRDNAPKEVTIENRDSFRCYGFKVTDVPGRDGIKPVTIGNVNLYAYKGV